MEYNYNKIFEEMKKLIHKSILIWFGVMAGCCVLLILLCLFHVIPLSALWAMAGLLPMSIALVFIRRYYHKRAEFLAKKQQLSLMAFHAKQALDMLRQDFPDTDISDCLIRMRYLAKNGIDVDAALNRLDGNTDAYNDCAASFLAESGHLEDTLYDLMQPDTLSQYGAEAHMLRTQANRLGIINLTDTAFFHEIEAYAGDYAIVKANWKKLSLELDEAYTLLSEYIKSIGYQRNTNGEHMTLKQWADRLQEAFTALEAYDTSKARNIIQELLQYQVDANISKSLQDIISNIDDIIAS